MAEQTWTDDPTASGDAVKGIHINELQDAVDAYNTAYSQAAATWTKEPVTGNDVEWEDLREIMNELDTIAAAAGHGGFAWTNGQPAALGDDVTSAQLEEARDNMNDLQANYCITCDSCDTNACTVCDIAYHALTCTVCNATCNANTCTTCDGTCHVDSCTCDETCHNDLCDLCNASCNGFSCTCNSICYSQSCRSDACNCHGPCFGFSCTCNSSCHNDVCDLCNATCNGFVCSTCDGICNAETGCTTCDGTCNAQSCTVCNQVCNSETCTQCNGVNYRYPWT